MATWIFAGTLDFVPGGILEGRISPFGATVLLALFMFGIGKAAMMPFHRWLPAAMVAPTPVSALLHAVAVVKAGVFSVVKVIVYTFGFDAAGANFAWLPYVAGFTIIAASIVALRADNLKRRLAYSTVSQLSYVVLAAAVLAPISVVGAALHIAAHAFGKITLFFAAGAIYTASHKTQVSELDGVGRRMPWTLAAFAVASLSMIGLPPTVGAISKWYIVTGALQAQHWIALAVIAASTLLNAGYFVPIVYRAFLREPSTAGPGTRRGAVDHGGRARRNGGIDNPAVPFRRRADCAGARAAWRLTVERHWLTRPETIRKLWALFIAVLAAVVLAELLVPQEAAFRRGTAVRLLRVVRFRGMRRAYRRWPRLSASLLKRPDTYYDDEAGDA